MELVKIIGVGLVTAVAAILLRSSKPELSFAVTIAGAVILLLFTVDMLSETIGIFSQIGEATGIDNTLIRTILKIVAIGYLVEFAAGIVEDFGAKSIADKLVFAGKVIIFAVAIPIVQGLVAMVSGFLELV